MNEREEWSQQTAQGHENRQKELKRCAKQRTSKAKEKEIEAWACDEDEQDSCYIH